MDYWKIIIITVVFVGIAVFLDRVLNKGNK
jgi:hypothetical protein